MTIINDKIQLIMLPIEIDGYEEYEVEELLNSQKKRRKLEYLMH